MRLTPLSLCEAWTAAIKAWGCWDSKSAPEILALTFKRHTTARTVSTPRTAATLRFNLCSLPHSTRARLHCRGVFASTFAARFRDLHLACSVALTPSCPIGAAY